MMASKPTYEELEKKVKKLKKRDVTYNQAKQSVKKSLEKQDGLNKDNSEPEMAVEVIEQEDAKEKAVEQVLIAEHIFRKAIEDSIPAGIAGIDVEGHQIYVNRAFCNMVGWSEAELLKSKYPFAYWPQGVIDSFKDDFRLVISGNVPLEGIELPFRQKNGKQFWGLVNSSDLHDSDGKIIGQLISVADISIQKRVENAMRDLSSKLVDAQESERKLVSQELHDSIGGKLTAIKYSLEKIISEIDQRSSDLGHPLDDLLSIVHDTIEETQRIYRNLHPSILDDLGLKAAMRSLCREFKEIYSWIDIESQIRIQEDQVRDSLKILVYRILQEAMNNIAKHSHADKVNISLKQIDKRIALIVEDNGVGFNLNEIQEKESCERNFGLDNIKERTELFGGTLTIMSAPKKGTVIRALWQLE
ncbi:MAG: PAS domain S-box protein [Thermodesulfobacteriota bacterium]|nr:PAS domain S-box protein [Thermodesulfobacteriota bacterium]